MDADTTLFTQSGFIAPGKAAICTATSMSGQYSTDYTIVVEITIDGGQKFTINRPAHFDSVGYTKANVVCKDVDIKDLPNGGKEVLHVAARKRSINFHA